MYINAESLCCPPETNASSKIFEKGLECEDQVWWEPTDSKEVPESTCASSRSPSQSQGTLWSVPWRSTPGTAARAVSWCGSPLSCQSQLWKGPPLTAGFPFFAHGPSQKFVCDPRSSPWAEREVSVLPSQTHFPCHGHVGGSVYSAWPWASWRGALGEAKCAWYVSVECPRPHSSECTNARQGPRALTIGSSWAAISLGPWEACGRWPAPTWPPFCNTIRWIHPILRFIFCLLREALKRSPNPDLVAVSLPNSAGESPSQHVRLIHLVSARIGKTCQTIMPH